MKPLDTDTSETLKSQETAQSPASSASPTEAPAPAAADSNGDDAVEQQQEKAKEELVQVEKQQEAKEKLEKIEKQEQELKSELGNLEKKGTQTGTQDQTDTVTQDGPVDRHCHSRGGGGVTLSLQTWPN